MTPNLSILIITYNRPEETLALLKNLAEQEQLKERVGEILLLNNRSTDDYSVVKHFIVDHPEVPINYLDSAENKGVAGGRNELIRLATFPYLLILDDDVVFPKKGAIIRLSELFSQPYFQKKNTAVITPKILYFDTQDPQITAFPHKKYHKYKGKDRFLTSYFTGACHLMKREIFEETGFYPEDFFYGMEEYDLSYRIMAAGYTLAYDNSVSILHKESPLGRVPPKDKLAMMWYNKCVVAWRYLPRKYFYSTALLWTFQYLRNTHYDFKGAWRNLKEIRRIPSKVKSSKVGTKVLRYLKKVEARLWY